MDHENINVGNRPSKKIIHQSKSEHHNNQCWQQTVKKDNHREFHESGVQVTQNTVQDECCLQGIFNECCLQGMQTRVQDDSIDLIVTDLPYGLSDCPWDTSINLDELWSQYKRVLKPYGTIVLFGKQPFTSRLVRSVQITQCSNILWCGKKTELDVSLKLHIVFSINTKIS